MVELELEGDTEKLQSNNRYAFQLSNYTSGNAPHMSTYPDGFKDVCIMILTVWDHKKLETNQESIKNKLWNIHKMG